MTPALQGPHHPLGTLDVIAVTLLLLGGFLAGIGWLIGTVLLWTSPRWPRREKLIGTLVLPGGIAGGLFAFAATHSGSTTECTSHGPCVTTTHTGWNPPGWLAAGSPSPSWPAPRRDRRLPRQSRPRPPRHAAFRAVFAVMAGVGAIGVLAIAGLVAVTALRAGGGKAEPSNAVPVSSPAQQSSSIPGP